MTDTKSEFRSVLITLVYSRHDGGWYAELYGYRGPNECGRETQTEVCVCRDDARRAAVEIALRDYPGVHIEEC